MPKALLLSPLGQLFTDVGRTLLIGAPGLPDRRWGRPISPFFKLLFLSICGLQLCVFLASALGGVGIWTFVRLAGGKDPLGDSLLLSFVFEGWFVVGAIFGAAILQMSRLWAIPPGVEWGWMGIRLGVLVFVIFFPMTIAELLNDETQSLATALVLLLSSYFFLKYGWKTVDEVMHLSPKKSASRSKLFVKGKNLIFISYRRDDSQSWTDSIARGLKEQFGEKVIFQDTMAIHPGEDFPERIKTPLQHCLVLLAVIGPGWVSAKDVQGNRRLDDQKDWVKFEIKSALQRDIPIFPLLVADAQMPSEKELPKIIGKLASKNGLPIRANPDFENDMNCLFEALKEYVN